MTVFFFFLSFRVLFLLEVKAQGKNAFANGLVLQDLCLFSNISYGSSFSGFVENQKNKMFILTKILKDAVLICQPSSLVFEWCVGVVRFR